MKMRVKQNAKRDARWLMFQLRFRLWTVAATQRGFLSENRRSKLSVVSKQHIFRENDIHLGEEDRLGGK